MSVTMAPNNDSCKCDDQKRISADNDTLLLEKTFLTQLNALTQLTLNDCALLQIPDSLGDIAALQCLDASHNNLRALPQSIGLLKGLVNLNLSYNQLKELPADFAQLDSLTTVNLSHNEFSEPPPCFQVGNANITSLDLSFNKIEHWRQAPLCAYGLKYFACASNGLKSNPPWIWNDLCWSLETLNLSCNELTNPTETVRLYSLWRTGVTVGLKILQLRNCGLTTDHLSLVHKLKAIETLDLGNESVTLKIRKSNFIWDISFKPFQSCHLREINLDGVGLSSLPEDINCIKTLTSLNCNNNHLQWLPESFTELVNLKYLSLSNNNLLYLPTDFGKLINIQELLLDYNKLEELPSSFADLQSLQYLDLYSNCLEDISSCIETLNSLCGLDVQLNYFHANIKEDLCSSLRKKRGLLNRPDGQLQKLETSYPSSYSSSYSEEDSLKDQEDADNPVEDLETSEENWDLEDEDHENFDPTVYCPKATVEMPARFLIIHSSVIGPDSFIPSDIHPSPSIRPQKDPFEPLEGQFEDA